MWQKLNKPQYFFRPSLLFYRLRKLPKSPQSLEMAQLPWGLEIKVRPSESIGSALYRSGFFDMIVSETLWRLLEVGEHCVDVGANIGYMTSLMAARVGHSGRVTAFEPHPSTFADLDQNVQLWADSPQLAPIDIHQSAVSNQTGTALFNACTARELAALLTQRNATSDQSTHVEVPLTTLDKTLENTTRISLMKVDVEGHELAVFEGATDLLASGEVRDIVFEDFGQYPTATMQLLESKGYSLFSLGRNFFGPVLFSPQDPLGRQPWDPPSFLATLNPERAIARMKRRGWQVLSGS